MLPPSRSNCRWLLLFGFVSGLAAATVTPLEGEPLSGEGLVWGEGSVTLAGRTLALADCDRVQDGAGEPRRLPRGLWLTDGSWLPISGVKAAAKDDRLLVEGPLGSWELPLAAVSGWGAQLLDRPTDGRDRLLLASGPLDGRILGLSKGRLRIATGLDPAPVEIDPGDIAGARIAGPVQPPDPSQTILLASLDGERPALRLRATRQGLRLAAVDLPVDSAALGGLSLLVDGPRRTYLSSLTPAEVHEEGAFGTIWPWQRDSNLDGTPLRLGKVRQARGISLHSAARLSWHLGGRYIRLKALAGIADVAAPEGDCPVTLEADGRNVWQFRLRGGESPRPVDLNLSGVQKLELIVELGERYDIGDQVVLADAWLLGR